MAWAEGEVEVELAMAWAQEGEEAEGEEAKPQRIPILQILRRDQDPLRTRREREIGQGHSPGILGTNVTYHGYSDIWVQVRDDSEHTSSTIWAPVDFP